MGGPAMPVCDESDVTTKSINEQLDLREGRILPSRRSSCSFNMIVMS